MLRKAINQFRYVITFPYNIIMMGIHRYQWSKFPTVYGRLYLRGFGKVNIGNNVVINSTYKTNFYGSGFRTIILCSGSGNLIIEDNVGISNSCIICEKEIQINKGAIIGNGCCIYDTDCHAISYADRRDVKTDIPKRQKVIIGENSFIGAGSTILKGVTIGNRSIIGAGSVVACDVPSDEIWAGNPAKFIKRIGKSR